MKVALLSFHTAYNYGAALQAYALQRTVEKSGAECEYINYQNDHRAHAYDMKYHFRNSLANKNVFGAAKSLLGMPVMAARAKGFNKFYSDYLRTTEEVYRNSAEAAELNGKYDKFIVGSDQVWNSTNNGSDTAFLLDFVDDNAKKISYSSSFGVSSLDPDSATVYGNLLKQFSRLSTRESIGTQIIEDVSGRKAHLVLDPVFLIGRDEWDKIAEHKNKKNKKKYIFFYTNRQSQITDFVNTGYITNEDLHVLSTHMTPREMLNPRIKTRISMTPGEFLGEIINADLVVTASFHCLAFCIVFHKPFIAILTGDHGKDERITNLLKITGLEDRVLTYTTSRADLTSIDYDEVEKKLKPYRESSEEYLKRAIFDEPDIPFDLSLQNDRFCSDSRCTGCGACEAICPLKAISMARDPEGFSVPEVDESKCVHCGKCHTVCQVFVKKESSEDIHCFAVKNSDQIRRVSSSGGVFRALAEKTFSENGIVCAAGMDESYHVYHMFAADMEELQPMCGTYYVQSDLKDSFFKIREYLNAGKKVLFVGTPCQVAGLKNFIGSSNDLLLTCDIICHGTPSPMVFEKFIEYLKTKGELSEFKFRNKSLGWKGYHVSAVINGKPVKNKLWLHSYNNMFSHNLINRLSCGSCQYTNYQRPGDITIGDFWGIEKSHGDFADSLGVSLVITNTAKGKELLESIGFENIIEVEKKETAQNSLLKPAVINSKRLQVFQTIRMKGFKKTIERFGEVNPKGFVKSIIRKALTKE